MATLHSQLTGGALWWDKSQPASSQTTQSASWWVRTATRLTTQLVVDCVLCTHLFGSDRDFLSFQSLEFRTTSWLPWSPVNIRPLLLSQEAWPRSAGNWRSSLFASVASSTSTSWSSPRSTKRFSTTYWRQGRVPAQRRKHWHGEWSVVLHFPLTSNG